jgi:hypothetical protein
MINHELHITYDKDPIHELHITYDKDPIHELRIIYELHRTIYNL